MRMGEDFGTVLPLQPGERVGRYRIVEPIGEGGWGIVFLAEQEEPVRRPVALKVIKLGLDTREVLARFIGERQALASLQHPNIAQVFDAGSTPAGRPFFVMELLRGRSVTEYCDAECLSTRERLELFIQICHGIQHAHDRGIIHRDIKPANVLVTSSGHGENAVPKIIDFGIAQAINGQRLADQTVVTAFDQFLGTPAYMSPEQTAWGTPRLYPQTDVYSLGILLYEILTGAIPYEPEQFRHAGLDQIRRIICEQEPPKPSTRLRTMGAAELNHVAKQRQAQPAGLIQLVRGDLDRVILRALEKEPARRYPSAADLGSDVRRFLENRPVAAAASGPWGHWRKLARRHPRAVRAVFALVLVVGLGVAVSEALLARERSARREALNAERTQMRFCMETKLRQLIDLANQLKSQGRLAEAELQYRQLIELQRKMLGESHPDVTASLQNLAQLLQTQRQTSAPESVLPSLRPGTN